MYSLKYCYEFQNIYKNFHLKPIKLACVFLKNEAFIVDKNDDVWHILNNRPRKLEELCQRKVKQFCYCYVAVGVVGYYAIVLLENGDVYGWGEDNYNLISDNKNYDFYKLRKKEFKYHPKFKNFYRRIKIDKIAIGQRHCLAITKHNRLVLWGDNTHGQLGCDSSDIPNPYNVFEIDKNSQTMTKTVLVLQPICNPAFISCFEDLIDKNLFYEEVTRVIPVSNISEINERSITHTSVVTHQPELNFVQLNQYSDIIGREGYKIKQIACGSYHSLVLLTCGDLYGFGSNTSGQLGILPQINRKEPIIILQHIDQVISTGLHTLALTFDKVLYSMGDNTYAQLGSLNPVLSSIPIEIKFKFTEISTINGLTMGKDENGNIYCWGYWGNEQNNLEADSENIHVESESQNSNQNSVIGEPKRVYCKTFEEIVARRFSITHYTISGDDIDEPENEMPYLIDPNSVSVLKEDAEIKEENLVKRVKINNREIDILKSRVEIVEKRPTYHIEQIGDKITSSLIGGLVVTDSSPSIDISGSTVTGKVG